MRLIVPRINSPTVSSFCGHIRHKESFCDLSIIREGHRKTPYFCPEISFVSQFVISSQVPSRSVP